MYNYGQLINRNQIKLKQKSPYGDFLFLHLCSDGWTTLEPVLSKNYFIVVFFCFHSKSPFDLNTKA